MNRTLIRRSIIILNLSLAAIFGGFGITQISYAEPESPETLPLTAQDQVLELPEGWNLVEVAGIQVSPNGEIVVFHRGLHQLLVFDPAGRFLREIGSGLFHTPHGLRIDSDGDIWTTDTGNHLVLEFASDGRVKTIFGKRGTAGEGWFDRDYNVPMFNKPNDVAFDDQGNIYVADGGNFRIVKFNSDGNLVTTWGTEGSEQGQFNFPHSVLIDKNGRVLVSDRENRRIQIFDQDGGFVDAWTHVGYPYGLTNGPKGNIWMADARAERVVKLDLSGQILGIFGQPGKNVGEFGSVHSITFERGGDILVSEIFNWRVQRLKR